MLSQSRISLSSKRPRRRGFGTAGTLVAPALLFSLACGARTETLSEHAAGGGPAPAPTSPGGPAVPPGPNDPMGTPNPTTRIEMLVPPTQVVDGDVQGNKLVARNGGFDLLASVDGDLAATRLTVSDRIETSASHLVQAGWGPSGQWTARSTELIGCGLNFTPSPIEVMGYEGAYTKTITRSLPSAAGCNGVAFAGAQGLLAIHRRPPSGECCSRPELVDFDDPSRSREALPDGEYGFLSLAAFGGEFAWAAEVADRSQVRIAFGNIDRTTTEFEIPTPNFDANLPRLAANPAIGDVLTHFHTTDRSVRAIAVSRSGTTRFDRNYPALTPDRSIGFAAAATTQGWLVASGSCSEGNGQVLVEHMNGTGDGEAISLDVGCPNFVRAAAVDGNVALVLWSDETGLSASAFRLAFN